VLPLKATATPTENIAPEPVTGRRGGFPMGKDEAVLQYKASMSIFKNWLESGLISGEELSVIDTMLSSKYGLSSCSIYRENPLLCKENRVIYSGVEVETNAKNCNEN
jgi:hypothetical protein